MSHRIRTGARVDPTTDHNWARFRRYWIGNLVSFIGDYFSIIAIPFVAFELSRSAFVVGVVEFAEMAVTVAFGVQLGRAADRGDLRVTLATTDAARAALLGLTAVVVAATAPSAWWIAALAVALGALRSVHDGAEHRLVPSLLDDDERIVAANARFGISDGAGQIVGSTLVGLVVGYGAVYAIGFDAVTFAFASAATWSIGAVGRAVSGRGVGDEPTTVTTPAEPATPTVTLRDTLAAIRDEDRFWRLLVVSGLSNITSVCFYGQFVVFATTDLHIGGPQIGATFAIQGVGGVIASVAIDRGLRPAPRWQAIGPALIALVPIAAALTRSWPVTMIGFAIVGAAVARDMAVLGVAQHVGFDPDIQGRIAMIRRSVLYVLIAPGIVAAGAVAERFGASALFIGTGIAGLAAPAAAVALGVHRLAHPASRATD